MGAQDAIKIFAAGVEAVKPGTLMPAYLKLGKTNITAGEHEYLLNGIDGIYVLAVGKAACAMAIEMEKILGRRISAGLVITKYGHALPLQYCTTIEAGHPLPDKNSVAAATHVVEFLKQLKPASLLLCCISGGASALLGDFVEGITLGDMQQLSALLLECGADIAEINTVRKHTFFLKGGQLVNHTNGARIACFIISDVPGDDLSIIASGLTVADASTFKDAWSVLEKYALLEKIPSPIINYLRAGLQGSKPETPKPGNGIFNNVHNFVTGSNLTALQAAALQATQLGYATQFVNTNLQGEAQLAAKEFVQQLQKYNGSKPACLLMGGETTVTIKGNGKGGRNQHFVLCALYELTRQSTLIGDTPVILSGGTDGTDGPTNAAGAYIDSAVVVNMESQLLNASMYIDRNDAYHFFNQLDALLVTGPTQTNVMDIVIGLLK
jgi:hydroxypyruvate reductase